MSATTTKRPRRRQWGADRQQHPMSAVPPPPGDAAIMLGRLGVALTAAAWTAFMALTVVREADPGAGGRPNLIEAIGFVLLITLLAYSSLAYMVARLGFLARVRRHRRVPRATLDEFYAAKRPSLTVLVPSYQEEEHVIRTTLLSAALQEYPQLRVVLLIDDSPEPRYARPHAMLRAARSLPGEISELLAEPSARFAAALRLFESLPNGIKFASVNEVNVLADHYGFAAAWLDRAVGGLERVDHGDTFTCNHVLGRLASDLRTTCAALRGAAAEGQPALERARVLHLYRRLEWTFSAEVGSFERKRYVSLSHEPNKAMNLNSYIGLMGSTYREVVTPEGRQLVRADDGDISIPDSDYILTLDADSVVLPEYCSRLVYELEQPRHERVAVVQTPYSSYPGAATRLERIAGATTDLQHIVHQGMTFHNATFWVGANAILRKRALDEVAEIEYLGDWSIPRYIRNRTVIEDSESSIDLLLHGWQLLNYPERLSYSATPRDFGSLCIQRHRWANGGLLILPKMWRVVRERRARGERTPPGEIYLRVNYLASVFWASLALLVLALRLDDRLLSPLLIVMALPYIVTIAFDLRYCGYKPLDVFRLYAFNLLLLPVNLAAAGSSIVQALTGTKGTFKRTPKVGDRTRATFVFVVSPYLLVFASLLTLQHAVHLHRWVDAGFAGATVIVLAYGIIAFIGLAYSVSDALASMVSWLYKPQAPLAPVARRVAPADLAPATTLSDWERVLYFGSAEGQESPAETQTRRERRRAASAARVHARLAASEAEG